MSQPPTNPSLTPLDIGHRQFPGRPGGYDRASVRAFLGQVADQLEALLHERQDLRARVSDLERELEARRQAEDEIRRAVVAAERIGHDLRENAARECELLLAEAHSRRQAIEHGAEARLNELEAAHQTRMQELEAAFRGRFADLERDHHQLTLERDRAHAERTVYLERTYGERHADLNARLSAVRGEYSQFVSQYRALMQSFAELSARHLPAGDDLALPGTTLPTSAAALALSVPPAGEEHPGPAERPGDRELTRTEEQQLA